METGVAVKAFLEAKLGLSQRSVDQYAKCLDKLQTECPELPTEPEPVRRALSKATSVWVRAGWWRIWRAFFRWCSWEYGTPNPMPRVEKPRPPDIEMRALEPGDLATVLASADGLRDKALLALALDCGVRASEFGGLRVADVGNDTLRVLGKGSRQARVPISPEARHLLHLLASQNGRGEPQSLLFAGPDGRPLSRHAVYRIVRRCMERAGIPGPKRGPHVLRHSLGMNFIADGGDAFSLRRVMRHRNIATTQKYVNLSMGQVVEQHQKHSPLRRALQGAQGVLWKQEAVKEAREILGGA